MAIPVILFLFVIFPVALMVTGGMFGAFGIFAVLITAALGVGALTGLAKNVEDST